MTSGRPPDAAVFPRAGTLVPPAVASVVSLPVALVFVGTVLLSVVLRWCCVGTARCSVAAGWMRAGALDTGAPETGHLAPAAPDRWALPRKRPSAGHGKPLWRQGAGGDPPWACRREPGGNARDRSRRRTGTPAGRSVGGPVARHDAPDRGQRRERGVVV